MKVIEEYRNQLFESDPPVGKPAGCREGISVFFHHHSFHLDGNFAGKSSIFLRTNPYPSSTTSVFLDGELMAKSCRMGPPTMVVGL